MKIRFISLTLFLMLGKIDINWMFFYFILRKQSNLQLLVFRCLISHLRQPGLTAVTFIEKKNTITKHKYKFIIIVSNVHNTGQFQFILPFAYNSLQVFVRLEG